MSHYVAAIEARMGDWRYYVTVMNLGEIATGCHLADEIHRNNRDLDYMIQREISDRVQKEMVPYLLHNPQRFYGALVVAVYGGEPEFSRVRVNEHDLIDDVEDKHSYGFGLLRFDGSQAYYALDGQHRLKSIQEAVKENPSLRKEQIAVILLKHENTQSGLERTRRLFSTLNRRAKPTSSGVNIALDEDDPTAIVTRRLVKENSYLSSLVACKSLDSKTLSSAKSNDPFITTFSSLYDTNTILLAAYKGGLEISTHFKQFRPSEDDLDSYYSFLEDLWIHLLERAPGFDEVLSGRKKPGDLRKAVDSEGFIKVDDQGKAISGGSIFARPIGQFIVAETMKRAGIQGKSMKDCATAILSHVSMDIDDAPWSNVVWNPGTRTIASNKAGRRLSVDIIAHALGLKMQVKVSDLRQQYRDMTNNPKASLLPPIEWSGRQPLTSEESVETQPSTTP
jgi:DNA sulfur modification protein DndB